MSDGATTEASSWVEYINAFVNEVVNYVWSTPMILALLGVGVMYTLTLGFIQFRGFKHAVNLIRGKYSKGEDTQGQLSHFQTLTTALSSTLGLGNISGVAVAISVGGPGAIFWMTLAGFLGMATKYAEATLAVKYRKIDENGQVHGGPMYYIVNGLGKKWKPLAVFFAVATALGTFGGPNMFQSNQVASILHSSFNIDVRLTGIVLTILTAIVILGGIRRIASVTSKVIPLMVVLYFLGSFVVILLNITSVPDVFAMIFHDAFRGTAAVGAFQGIVFREVLIFGIRRACFSNEAGLGSAPIAHATAATNEPVREGTVALLEPFIDSMISLFTTAMVILLTGVWIEGNSGVVLTAQAFDSVLPSFGLYFIPVMVFLFGYTTLLSWSYYGETALKFLVGHHRTNVIIGYKLLFCLAAYAGAVWSLDPIIAFADMLFGFMVIPNLIALVFLSRVVIRDTNDYFRRLKAGEFDKVKS